MCKKIKYVHFIVMILSCLILSGCFDMEGRVEIRKDGSGIVSYALVTDPSFAEAFKQSKCFTQGEKVRNYIKEGKFYHEGSKTFSSLAELDLKDEKISVNESRYEHIIYPEKQQNSREDKALSVLLLKGHFFTYNFTLPESVRKAYPVEIGGIEIEPTIKDNTASWKIPMELIASAEKEVIFKADLTKPFSTSIPQNISEATVTGIVDGDTLEVTYGNEQRQIRLIGIDTPETVVNEKTYHDANEWGLKVQEVLEMGEEATRYVESIVKKGDKIKPEFEDPKVDPHNRLLSYVHLKDGRFLNAELLRKGYARTFFRDWKDGREFEQKRYNDKFQRIEEEAKRNKVGFWKIWLSTTNLVKRLDLEISEVSVGPNKNELSLLKDKRLINRGIEIVQKIVDYLPAATNQRIGTWKFGVIEGDNAYGEGGNIIAGSGKVFF
jgi:endonuclease YncB( thermonuclease family)